MAQEGFAKPLSLTEITHELESEEHDYEQTLEEQVNTPDKLESAAPTLLEDSTNTPKDKKGKRSRRGSKSARTAIADHTSEDLNLHVDADWSEDEKYEKEHPAKRLATNTEDGNPVAAKKNDSVLDDFTIRAVVTRKDVDVIFGHESSQKPNLEGETKTTIDIVAGKDDPEIVVDRVLSIRGHIDNVASAYKNVADGILSIKKAAEEAASKSEKPAPPAEDNNAPAQPSEAESNAATTTDDIEAEGASVDNIATNADEDTASKPGSEADEEPKDSVGTKPEGSVDGKPQPASASPQPNKPRITLRMLVPHKCVGSIMGHGGKTINKIRDSASVSIHTSESTLPRSSERIVELVGAPESIEKAIKLIAVALTKDITAYYSADYYIPAANLPSAMTVDTQARKRKDIRRPGHNDNHTGRYNHNRNMGFRHGHNPGGAANGGYSQMRGQIGQRNNGNRYGRGAANRQGGRNRGSGHMSGVNRIPIGGTNNNSANYSRQHGGGNFRNQSGMRSGPPPAMGFGGYAVPAAATAAYPVYAAQGALANGSNANTQYGNNNAPSVGAPSSAGAYGGAYGGGGATPYQLAVPAGYGYAPAPMPGGYGARTMVPAAATAAAGTTPSPYQQRSYSGYSSRPPLQQPSMGMGMASSSHAPSGSTGQTVQQIYVPGDRIGAVIGRRGETINMIRRSTNARVDIQDSAQGAKERLVVITGEYEQVRSAYDQIKTHIENARPSSRSF
ncbi:RNA binding protein, heterogenous nuclear RNP-K like protein [Coemansia brasiliensis]|uniref:RNA binding protein, heterogenous nuclear RNP-K like protein n=1 Tax=Coemansia brasiliensis TaxID=2650707 RepID=A0A9W8IGE1_9FUNG|nr:RNA binding protein, heterogenous nuclear RNP-K like protein [Coemansia brasiliensis]